MECDKILEIKNLSFSYDGKSKILDDISLQVFRGDRIGILGPNGGGKTSLFLMISGVEQPLSGKILLYGSSIKPGKFNPEIGMVFQDSNDQVFNLSVYEDIAFGPRNLGLAESEVGNRVNSALEQLGIMALKHRPPHRLSGGERRLVAIAGGILAMHSRVALYDEPTSNLDIKYRRKLIDFINQSSPEALLIASHDLEFVLEVCSRVIILDEGTICADGPPAEILANKDLMESHSLEVPYSLLLQGSDF